MSSPVPPIQLQLTEEQQALIQRLSGQFAQVLELVPDATDGTTGDGHALNFRWRLSVASGIPRQQWDFGRRAKDASPDQGASG